MSRSLRIGEIVVHVLRDGADRVPPEMILAGAPTRELARITAGHVDRDGQLPVAYNGLLVRSGDRLVLVDAGSGESGETDGTGGALGRELVWLGFSPDDVDDVVVSHAHSDHVGGLTSVAEGRHVPTYPRARHWFWHAEWAYWTSPTVLASLPEYLADAPTRSLPPLDRAGLVHRIDREEEVAPGVRIVPAPGHTPGHVALAIDSSGGRALYVGDALFHRVNVTHPRWGCDFDVDRVAAAKSRRLLLDRAVTDQSLVLAAHIAEPGRIVRRGRGYEFVAET